MAKIGGELNEARCAWRASRTAPALVANKVSGAPGFCIGNVIVMAGVPAIMQAMLDEVAPKLKTGTKMLSETIRADAKEGDVGTELGAIAKAHPDAIIGSYPFYRREARTQHQHRGALARCRTSSRRAKAAVEDMLARSEVAAAAAGVRRMNPMAKPQPDSRAAAGKKLSRCRGTNFTATRARWPGGCTRPGRSTAIVCITRGGLVPAAIVARELNVRLIETVCVASYHDYKNQGELKVLKGVAPEVDRDARGRARAC